MLPLDLDLEKELECLTRFLLTFVRLLDLEEELLLLVLDVLLLDLDTTDDLLSARDSFFLDFDVGELDVSDEKLREGDDLLEERDVKELSRDLAIFCLRLELTLRTNPISSSSLLVFSPFLLFRCCLLSVSCLLLAEESEPELCCGWTSVSSEGGNVGPNISPAMLSDKFRFLSGFTLLSSYDRVVLNFELPTKCERFVLLVSAGTQVASACEECRCLLRAWPELEESDDDDAWRFRFCVLG